MCFEVAYVVLTHVVILDEKEKRVSSQQTDRGRSYHILVNSFQFLLMFQTCCRVNEASDLEIRGFVFVCW